jgi:hypothetical protein
MFKATRQTLMVAAVIAAASAPSSAYAMVIAQAGPMSPRAASATTNPTAPEQTQLGDYQRAVAKRLEGTPGGASGPVVQTRSTERQAGISASNGFQWGDAGIGAAGVVVLIVIGFGGGAVIRRRVHHPLAS